MRTKNSFRNMLVNSISQVVTILLSFVARTVFIYTLSQEYLGVNGLFSNILMVLNLAELGIGAAMLFYLYEPIAKDNKSEICSLMNMYRRLYRIVALIIAIVGVILVPFLPYLIKDEPNIPYLSGIYLLYLFHTVSTYFFSYKRTLIEANQMMWVTTAYTTALMIAQFIGQIIVLILTKNFIIYLCVMIICSIATNVCIAIKADKMYPFLKEDTKTMPSDEVKRGIFKNIGAMSMHRLGDVVVNNTDNLVMSAFVGLSAVGIYSNYLMIQASIVTAMNSVLNAFSASIGNLFASKNEERMFEVYKALLFLGFWIFSFCSVEFIVLYNPFIENWAGSNYLFSMDIVLAIVIIFYIHGIRKVTIIFRDAMGLYWHDRYKPVFEVIINIVTSIVLVIKIGVLGIFLGTIISNIAACIWVEPLITYKYGFHQKVSHYFKTVSIYTIIAIIAGYANYYICNMLPTTGWVDVFARAFLVLICYNTIIFLLFFKTAEFRELWKQFSGLIAERRKKA